MERNLFIAKVQAVSANNAEYIYIFHVHHGLWGHINQLCGQFVYIYSPCCNSSSLYCPRMRLCDPRQCGYCTTYFQWKTICCFMAEHTLCYKVIRCPRMHINCGCWHSLLHLERLMMSYL